MFTNVHYFSDFLIDCNNMYQSNNGHKFFLWVVVKKNVFFMRFCGMLSPFHPLKFVENTLF